MSEAPPLAPAGRAAPAAGSEKHGHKKILSFLWTWLATPLSFLQGAWSTEREREKYYVVTEGKQTNYQLRSNVVDLPRAG